MDIEGRLLIDPTFEERLDLLHQDLLRDDEVGMIVRGQIAIEDELRLYVSRAAHAPGRLKKLPYAKLVDAAVENGLIMDLAKPLRALGKLRNRIAHERTCIEAEDASSIFYSFNALSRNICSDSYSKTRLILQKLDRPERITELHAKEQCVFHLVCLWSLIVAQTHQLRRT